MTPFRCNTSDPVARHSLPLYGRHALVTGAGSGIGEAVSLELARQGATLSLLGRHQGRLEATCARLSGNGHGIVLADITDHAQVVAAIHQSVAARGPISLLINNAGAATSAPLVKTDPAAWQSMITTNLTGSYYCIHAVLPDMLAVGWGRIVNVASTAGLQGYAYAAPYCAAKHGLVGLTRALALEVAEKGITVNAVCPGYTDTPLFASAVDTLVRKTGRSIDDARATLAASNPQGRLIQPAEVAQVIVRLCLPGTESIHGQAITVPGDEAIQ
jgi:NAD(P)-dependent dehydrogenase (short-subunit alcohol dehydrogenase family)